MTEPRPFAADVLVGDDIQVGWLIRRRDGRHQFVVAESYLELGRARPVLSWSRVVPGEANETPCWVAGRPAP